MSETLAKINKNEDNGEVSAGEFLPKLYGKLKELFDRRKRADGEDSAKSRTRLEETYNDIFKYQEEFERRKLFKDGEKLWSQWLSFVVEEEVKNETVSGEKVTIYLEDPMKHLTALAYNNRGYMRYLQVDFEGAILDYTESLKLNPVLACSYYNRGLVTYRLAFFDQSCDDMKKAVSLDPNNAVFLEGLERVKEMVGSPKGYDFKLE